MREYEQGMASPLPVLRASVDRLADLVSSMDESMLQSPAYPTEWTIADVLSHLGSGAVISQRRTTDALAGRTVPDEFPPSVWDTWNAKSPTEKAADALVADSELVESLESLSDQERSRINLPMGPLTFDFDQMVELRLNEHALHSWDIAVVVDPSATLAPDATELVVDNLGLIATYTAKPTGVTRSIVARTTQPARDFTVELTPEAVSFETRGDREPDVVMPAEAFIRLVHGRLDPDHTPPVDGDSSVLVDLRRTYPGP
jgi:uncharacterized protein (TIGR03083 family)